MPTPKKPQPDDIELHPDAWARFESFVKAKVRAAPPPPKNPAPTKTAPKRKKA